MSFTITTTREVAEKIKKQCEFDAKSGFRTYELGGISHSSTFSIVQIKAKGNKINPEDIFWLGHFSANQ